MDNEEHSGVNAISSRSSHTSSKNSEINLSNTSSEPFEITGQDILAGDVPSKSQSSLAISNELESKLKELEGELDKAKTQIKQRSDEIMALHVDLDDSRSQNALKDSTLKNFQCKLDLLYKEREEKEATISELNHKLLELCNVGVSMYNTDDDDAILKLIRQRDEALNDARDEIEKLKKQLQTAETEMNNQKATIRNLQDALLTAKRDFEDLKNQSDSDVSLGKTSHFKNGIVASKQINSSPKGAVYDV